MTPENKTNQELKDIFERINSCAEKLSDFDLWDKDTMTKINNAEKHLRNAMTEIIEITGDDEPKTN